MPDVGLLTPGADLTPGSAAAGTDDVAVLRAMLAVEAAWVRAQARCGVVPAVFADVVAEAVGSLASDDDAAARLTEQVARDAVGAGNPVVPLLAALRAAVRTTAEERVGGDAVEQVVGDAVERVAGAVHAGLTSQDVLDTALVLVLRDAARAAGASLDRAVDAVAGLARAHRDDPALARTLTQAAAATTLGARFAGWLQGVAAARDRLRAVHESLPLAAGGAAGTFAGTVALTRAGAPPSGGEGAGVRAEDDRAGGPFLLVEAWADELGLAVPVAPWHVVRTPVVRAAQASGEVCAALGTVAADVLLAVRPEIAELREPAAAGRGASSAMPHKRNPVLSVLLRRSALAAPPLVAQVTTAAGLAVDERPDGAWHAEWPALQLLARHTVASAHLAAELLGGLEVDAAAAARNLREHLDVDPAVADTGVAGAVVDRVLDELADPAEPGGPARHGGPGRPGGSGEPR